jgi:hypothetical protein
MAISRREFLKRAALSLGGILTRSILPSPLRRERRFAQANSTVAIVTGEEFNDDLALMTRHAISLATGGAGMSSIVKPEGVVFIKPNLTGMARPSTGDTTKPPSSPPSRRSA